MAGGEPTLARWASTAVYKVPLVTRRDKRAELLKFEAIESAQSAYKSSASQGGTELAPSRLGAMLFLSRSVLEGRMVELPEIEFLRRPLDPGDVLRGERMCAAAGTRYASTSVLRPWRVLKKPPPPCSSSKNTNQTK